MKSFPYIHVVISICPQKSIPIRKFLVTTQNCWRFEWDIIQLIRFCIFLMLMLVSQRQGDLLRTWIIVFLWRIILRFIQMFVVTFFFCYFIKTTKYVASYFGDVTDIDQFALRKKHLLKILVCRNSDSNNN